MYGDGYLPWRLRAHAPKLAHRCLACSGYFSYALNVEKGLTDDALARAQAPHNRSDTGVLASGFEHTSAPEGAHRHTWETLGVYKRTELL
jgi:hypothetical protein